MSKALPKKSFHPERLFLNLTPECSYIYNKV